MTTAILGTPVGVGNRGVTALSTSLVSLCVQRTHGGEVFLMVGHHRPEKVLFRLGSELREIQVVNCRLSPKARIREHLFWILFACLLYRCVPFRFLKKGLSRLTPWIAALERADVAGDVRGGDSFSDMYGLRRFLEGFAIAWTVVLVKGWILQFPQTYGPFKSWISRVLAAYLLRSSPVIMARDRESQRIAAEMAGIGSSVVLCPDVAFSLEALKPGCIEVEPGLAPGAELPRFIGLNVNGLMYNGGYNRQNMFNLKMDYARMLPHLVEELLKGWEGELWFVPHTYGQWKGVENDLDASREVLGRLSEELKARVRLVTGNYDCQELKWIIGKSEFFVGSRMHSCIAALSQGVPCVGIAYSKKFEGVFDTVGMADWVLDGRKVGNEEAISRVIELYHKRNEIRQTLIKRSSQAQKMLEKTFDELFHKFRISLREHLIP